MAQPFVSILIPAFNAQSSIRETLLSACAQTWPHKEIIVVDDGSSDQTFETVKSLHLKDVRAYKQDQQGAAAARNAAYALCKGDYIQWLDADDILAPDKIEQQIKTVQLTNNRRTLFSSAFGQFMYRPSRATFVPSALWTDLSPAEWLLYKLETNAWMQTACWLVSRELSELSGPWDTRMAWDDDGEYFCRVLLHSDKICFVSQSKVYYRTLGYGSLGYVGNSATKREAMWRSIQLHIDCMRSLDDGPRARSACVALLQRYLIHFYPHDQDPIKQAQALALELGGQLFTPTLPWKYSWMQRAFGWTFTKNTQRKLRQLRWSLQGFCDRALHEIGV